MLQEDVILEQVNQSKYLRRDLTYGCDIHITDKVTYILQNVFRS